MKTFHIHTKVKNLEESKKFYTTMFNSEPSVEKDNYIKWKLLDPAINFAISLAGDKEKLGVDHFGLQTENNEELEEIHKNLEKANIQDSEQKNASCCYALSDKYWSMDPTNIPWEVFHTLDEVKMYGSDKKKFSTSSVCCG